VCRYVYLFCFLVFLSCVRVKFNYRLMEIEQFLFCFLTDWKYFFVDFCRKKSYWKTSRNLFQLVLKRIFFPFVNLRSLNFAYKIQTILFCFVFARSCITYNIVWLTLVFFAIFFVVFNYQVFLFFFRDFFMIMEVESNKKGPVFFSLFLKQNNLNTKEI